MGLYHQINNYLFFGMRFQMFGMIKEYENLKKLLIKENDMIP